MEPNDVRLDDAVERTYAAIADNIPEHYLAAIDAYTAAIVARERRKATAVVDAAQRFRRSVSSTGNGEYAMFPFEEWRTFFETSVAAALAGVPKEAGEASDEAIPARDYWLGADDRPDAEIVAFVAAWKEWPTLSYEQAIALFDAGKAAAASGVVAAPVEDAK